MQKITHIFFNAIPVLLMMALIPFVANDYIVMLYFIAIIIASFNVKRKANDLFFLVFGFVIMTLFEYLFITTGVEGFKRNTLLGVMPIWLPFLWAYGFVAMKRSIEILNK